MKAQYVFIVGLPRTGTKLSMNILAKCRERTCHIIHENFFLGRVLRPGVMQKMRRIGDMSIDANVDRLVDAMYSGKFYGEFWHDLARGRLGIDRGKVRQRILDSDRSDRAIYAAMLQADAEDTEDTILGDKSGPNLYRVPTLLEWFPNAKIIHTFRDPRAIMASELKKRHRLAKTAKNYAPSALLLRLLDPILFAIVFVYITAAWLYAVKLHHKYQRLYPDNYCLLKFEDLVTDPERNVRELCQFLGIQFHAEMLNPPQVDSSYSRAGGIGFDSQTLTRWRDDLRPWMNAWLLFWTRKHLGQLGYAL